MKTEKASPKPPEETSGFPESSINAQSGGSHGGGSERSTVSSFSEPRRWCDLNTGNRVQIQTGNNCPHVPEGAGGPAAHVDRP